MKFVKKNPLNLCPNCSNGNIMRKNYMTKKWVCSCGYKEITLKDY